MTNQQEYIVYKRDFAYKLRKMGYKIVRTEPNPEKPEFDCYVFENSEQFRIDIDRLRYSCRKKRGV